VNGRRIGGIGGFGGFGGRGAGDIDCAQAQELAPELALGLLDGAERAAVLAHLDRCPACRRDVASLTELGEHLLLLAPRVPPPAGFESDVLAQLAPERRQRRRRRSRRVLGAVAAALLAAAGMASLVRSLGDDGGSGEVRADGARSTTSSTVAEQTAIMRADTNGRVVGETVLRQIGADMEAELALEEGLREYYAQTAATGEHKWWLAVFDVSGSHTMYPISFDQQTSTVTLDQGPGQVRSIAVVDETHRPWCSGDVAVIAS
jgi:hypothetical protein